MRCTFDNPCGPLTVDTTSIRDTGGARCRLICLCGHSHWRELAGPPVIPPPVKWAREAGATLRR